MSDMGILYHDIIAHWYVWKKLLNQRYMRLEQLSMLTETDKKQHINKYADVSTIIPSQLKTDEPASPRYWLLAPFIAKPAIWILLTRHVWPFLEHTSSRAAHLVADTQKINGKPLYTLRLSGSIEHCLRLAVASLKITLKQEKKSLT